MTSLTVFRDILASSVKAVGDNLEVFLQACDIIMNSWYLCEVFWETRGLIKLMPIYSSMTYAVYKHFDYFVINSSFSEVTWPTYGIYFELGLQLFFFFLLLINLMINCSVHEIIKQWKCLLYFAESKLLIQTQRCSLHYHTLQRKAAIPNI